LSGILSQASPEGAALLDLLRRASAWAPALGPSGLLGWAIKTALADGKLDENEEQTLVALAAKNSVPRERVISMLQMARMGELRIPDPPDAPTAHAWLAAMAAVAMSDGAPQPQEVALMTAVAKKYGFCDADVTLLLKQTRNQRLSEVREAVRAAGGNGASA
jgi:hypothetical protein